MMGEIFTIVLSILSAFVLGIIAMMFVGGRIVLSYLKVKASRGKKILLFVKTRFGWQHTTAIMREQYIVWKKDKITRTSVVPEDSVSRFLRVDCLFLHEDDPLRTIGLAKGSFYPADFDPEVYNNILLRAQTAPDSEGTDDIKKLIVATLFLSGLALLFVVIMFFKVSQLSQTVGVI